MLHEPARTPLHAPSTDFGAIVLSSGGCYRLLLPCKVPSSLCLTSATSEFPQGPAQHLQKHWWVPKTTTLAPSSKASRLSRCGTGFNWEAVPASSSLGTQVITPIFV